MLRQPLIPNADVDWSISKAYGLGINRLYLNLKGRQRDGIVEPGEEAEKLIKKLKERLEEEVDQVTGQPVIRQVYRARQSRAVHPLRVRTPGAVVDDGQEHFHVKPFAAARLAPTMRRGTRREFATFRIWQSRI